MVLRVSPARMAHELFGLEVTETSSRILDKYFETVMILIGLTNNESNQEHESTSGCPSTMMNKLTMIFLLCVHTGCASKPLQVSDKEELWPHAVNRTCPDRKVLPECFRRQDIDLAMKRLLPFMQNCLQQAGDSTLVKLTVETKDGRPSCIEHRLNGNETAECVAGAVARGVVVARQSHW